MIDDVTSVFACLVDHSLHLSIILTSTPVIAFWLDMVKRFLENLAAQQKLSVNRSGLSPISFISFSGTICIYLYHGNTV